jgi:hypothetical protein
MKKKKKHLMSIWVGFESLFVVVVVVGEEGLEI